MQDKVKIIAFAVIAILLVTLIYYYNTSQTQIKNLTTERDGLLQTKADLEARNAKLSGELKSVGDQLKLTQADLERVNGEKQELQIKVDGLIQNEAALRTELEGVKKQLEEFQKNKDKGEDKQGSAGQFMTKPSQSISDELYWATILKKKADLELQLDAAQAEIKAVKLANDQLKVDKNTVTLELTNIIREFDDAKRQFEYNQKMLDTVSTELAREKNDKLQIAKTLNILKTENKLLRHQVKLLGDKKVDLESKVNKLQDKNSNLEKNMTNMEVFVKEKILQMDSFKRQLDNANADIKAFDTSASELVSVSDRASDTIKTTTSSTAVQLPPIFVKSDDKLGGRKVDVGVSGSVMAVNSLGGFIIINIGEEAGVRVGDAFNVYRGNKLVANIEVIQNRQKISACDLKKEIIPVEIGDIVKPVS